MLSSTWLLGSLAEHICRGCLFAGYACFAFYFSIHHVTLGNKFTCVSKFQRFVVVVSLFPDIEKMKQIFCLLLSLFAVTYAQKARGLNVGF